MCRAKWVNRAPMLLLVAMLAPISRASPGDESVELYLRGHGMDTLLEVQLESRLDEAQSNDKRAEIAENLAQLYLTQLRATDSDDPYRQVLVIRARDLLSRVSAAPLFDLRIELFINDYALGEDAVELYQLGLLEESGRDQTVQSFIEISRGLRAIMSSIEPELNRLTRRRGQSVGTDEAQEIAAQIETKRRLHSLAAYYMGWSGYGIAVLEDRHVEDTTFIAFAWLLGGEGSMPQQAELRHAAIEFEHVARAAIGVAMCYAQSENESLALAWLNELIDSNAVSDEVRSAAESRKLRVLAASRDWYKAHTYIYEISDADAGAYLSVPDARFVAMRALDSRVSGLPGKGGEEQAVKVATLGIEHLVGRGEIGHVVDLYQRYERLPLIASGFIPNYARAIAELEQAEANGLQNRYLDIAGQFNQALQSPDASAYPEHREDCRLKLAYTLIRADRPQDAVEQCDQIIERSIRAEAIQEARWLKLAALDRQNVISGKASSPELDQAVRAFVEAYPDAPRTTKLVLRHAMRGTLDEQFAIETLAGIAQDDPIAIPARRTLVQLQYQTLRSTGFADQAMLKNTRELIDWLLQQPTDADSNQSTAQTQMAILRIGIDLALRDTPSDPQRARVLIEVAQSRLGTVPSMTQLEAELLVRSVQIALIEDQIDLALATIDRLRGIDQEQAEYAELLTLNRVIERWDDSRLALDAERLTGFGVSVLARMTPKAPEHIGIQTSRLAEVISDAAELLGSTRNNPSMTQLALRLSKQIIERGSPSEPGLQRTARLAESLKDRDTQLEAWLRLLASYHQDDERWYEARYESLRVMMMIDPTRAIETYQQYKVLNPTLGPAPWNQRIATLFNETAPDSVNSTGGARP